jgi:hypothetical protein
MNIVCKTSFRSKGTLVNQSDDMYRITIDMSYREYAQFTQYKSRQEKGEQKTFDLSHNKAGRIKLNLCLVV